MKLLSCAHCEHNKVCITYIPEMKKRDYWHRDFAKELKKLQVELGNKCKDYLKGDNDE